ncbi:DNA polymerase IV [Paenibacillus sp. UNC499MF]|uniref:DNA polymerase IV n=1 Tax=Paenibacillus sp. UNC499MF TaxID=1502751 RepID=UPI0008A01E35|nr:DNA polymerase IV [Paenibacillus sp. UNC499MF]SEF56144.1 DNA polymerase-4 [Paenibacillus sp. UNC499MF]
MTAFPEQGKRIIMLADCQSFYASVEKAAHPEFRDKPVVVAGDPARRSGIILAACPLAKAHGVTTAERLGEALRKCPEAVVIRPRMEEYIKVSMQITAILQTYTDLVEPFSIDEQYLDVTGSLHLFGTPVEIARDIQHKVLQQTGVWTRVGISENKVLAKMACDNFAKKNREGIFVLPKNEIASLWELPVSKTYLIGSRMTRHLNRMGILTVGDLAKTPLARLRARWGINGEVIWRVANGIDPSPVTPQTHEGQKAVGHQMTLPRDYATAEEIKVVLLELSELVCQRCRAKGRKGQVVSVGCQGADYDHPSGFYRQMKLPDPTQLTDTVYETAQLLFRKHWDGLPVRKVGVTLGDLVPDDQYQLLMFGDEERKIALERTTDTIRQRFGSTAIMRAVSATPAGQAKDRSHKIGGHYK